MKDFPSISIVTPSFNQGQYIEKTICSVLNQNYPNLEYIIIDGGSTDNSVEIIKKYEKNLTFWVSEKDKGQANAINKGLRQCTGEIFNWLNSDDYLEKDALLNISEAFSDKIDIVAGKVNNFSVDKSEIIANKNLSSVGIMCWESDVHFVQPGVWMRRKHLLQCQGIDERFHYAFDWDLLIRYLYFFPNVAYLDDVLVNFRLHKESKTVSDINRFAEEEEKIIEKLIHIQEFSALHRRGKYKTKRTAWSNFLNATSNNDNIRTIKKLEKILFHLNKQPLDWPVTRMTMGALKKILNK